MGDRYAASRKEVKRVLRESQGVCTVFVKGGTPERLSPQGCMAVGRGYITYQDYANEREKGVVSGQEVWLGLGAAVRLAGMGGARGVAAAAFGGSGVPSTNTCWPLRRVHRGAWNCPAPHLPSQRGGAALALGKALDVVEARSHALASHLGGLLL